MALNLSNDNSQIKSQPEWQQEWKESNNPNNCCTSCNKEEEPVCATISQFFTRGDMGDDLTIRIEDRYCKCQGKNPVSVGCKDC